MGTQSDAAAALKKYIAQHKGLMLVADILEQCGSFENAQTEAEAAYKKAERERVVKQAELDELIKISGTTKQAYKDIVDEAATEANDIREQAKQDAIEDIAISKADAEKILKDARGTAGNVEQASKDKLAVREAEHHVMIENMEQKLVKLNKSNIAAEKTAAELEGKLSTLNEQLEAMKARVSRLLG